MMDALRLHDGVIDSAAAVHHGVSVKPRGEGGQQVCRVSISNGCCGGSGGYVKGTGRGELADSRPSASPGLSAHG